MNGVLGTKSVAQVGIIVKDIETTKKKWAEFLGVEVPPTYTGGEYAITQMEYKGNPAPDAACFLAFFDVNEGFQIELIQPNEEPSTWREFLDTKGEGLHHIAFQIQGMKKMIMACEDFGMKLEQKGEYGDASGRYAYLSGEDNLKTLIELLESGKA